MSFIVNQCTFAIVSDLWSREEGPTGKLASEAKPRELTSINSEAEGRGITGRLTARPRPQVTFHDDNRGFWVTLGSAPRTTGVKAKH